MRSTGSRIAYAAGTVSSPLLYHAMSGYRIFFFTDVVLERGRPSRAGRRRP